MERIQELEINAIHAIHKKNGAQILHLEREDQNNVFSVGFETAPTDSTGVAHILEHTVLCGSEKYPIRDPFFKMLNRSMSTYMNAWTSSDFTMYPFSTQNHKDMENLRSVYLDAAFNPILSRQDFLQEGWRLENENHFDKKTPIIFKGVVYNEMKGAISDVGYLFCLRQQNHLFPGTTYSHSSGGDPKNITELTHDQLVEFHRTRYNPSNARVYSYGNYPLEGHLKALDDVLGDIPSSATVSVPKLPKTFDAPKEVEETCPKDPYGDPLKQTKVSISFLTNMVSDSFETFAMRILSYLLIDGQASPFHKALIDSNLGSEYAASTGYDTTTENSSFSIGLQGISKDDVEKVKSIVSKTFEDVMKTGFDEARIESAIHQLELSTKQKTANFGMNISLGVMSSWMHGGDPFQDLNINENIKTLRSKLKEENFFQNLIKKYFIENNHKLTFIMSPDDEYSSLLANDEARRLEQKTSNLGETERANILDDGIKLAKDQDSFQDLSCLPCLELDEISRDISRYPIKEQNVGDFSLQTRITQTNQLSYFRSLLILPELRDDLVPFVPLFANAVTSLGTSTKSAAEFDEKIRLHTGGIGASEFLATSHSNIDGFQLGLEFSGQCLDRNINRMYDLLSEAVNEVNLNNEAKLKTLILGSASSMMNSLAHNGHQYARSYASSGLSYGKHISELQGGLSHVNWINQLATNLPMDEIIANLREISDTIKQNGKVRLALNCSPDDESIATNLQGMKRFLALADFNPQRKEELDSFTDKTGKEIRFGEKTFIKLPFSTNFSATAFKTVPMKHDDSVKYQVLTSLLTHQYLHKEIREKGGAYGGGSVFSPLDGILSFFSYRDPNPEASVSAYESSLRWAAEHDFTEQQLKEAKLSILGKMDSPLGASAEGMAYFKGRINDGIRQQRRNNLFATTKSDINRLAQTLLNQADKSNKVILAGTDVNGPKEGSEWMIKEI